MATSTTQRVGIWIIAIFMAVGTIGSFVIIVLANQNGQSDQTRLSDLTAAYQKEVEAYNKKLSDKYLPQIIELKSKVAAFDKDAVTELVKNDLTVGTGEAITSTSAFNAYYIGWNPAGKIFDSSLNDAGDALVEPIAVVPGGVIEGWTQGVDGMKEGGVRELTIPSSLAYKDQARGEDIPANSPLKFIIVIIPASDVAGKPQPSAELLKLYSRLNG